MTWKDLREDIADLFGALGVAPEGSEAPWMAWMRERARRTGEEFRARRRCDPARYTAALLADRERKRRARAADPEKHRARAAAYYRKNRAKALAKARAWQERNRQRSNATKRAWHGRRSVEQRTKHYARARAWITRVVSDVPCSECGAPIPLTYQRAYKKAGRRFCGDRCRARSYSQPVTLAGRTRAACEWARFFGVCGSVVATRLGRGWSPEDALLRPPRPTRSRKG